MSCLFQKSCEKALEVYELISGDFNIEYDESGSIGKRYRRQDAIGTPFCITIDFDSLEDEKITLRFRDSMEQTRLNISDVKRYIETRIKL